MGFHVDTTGEEAITMIYYLNPTYELDEGGCTELFVDDEIVGIENELKFVFGSIDKMLLHLKNLINREFGFKWSSTVKNTKLKEIGIEEYLNFENHILIDVDYPISSNPIHTYGQNPSYIRTIFKRKTI